MMDEITKTVTRNYLAAAGFLLIGLANFLELFGLFNLSSTITLDFEEFADMFLAIGLIAIATMLIILRKRDLFAIVFMMYGFLNLTWTFSPFIPAITTIVPAFVLLIALVTLVSKDKQKWFVFILPLILFIYCLFLAFADIPLAMNVVFDVLLAVVAFYLTFACGADNLHLPGSKLLRSDQETDFKASGSVLGYVLFLAAVVPYIVYYLVGETNLPYSALYAIELVSGSLLMFTAILLFFVAKMRFEPLMFFLMGQTAVLNVTSYGWMYIAIGIAWIIVGLLALFSEERKVLPGIMLLIYGCTCFFSAGAGGVLPSIPVLSAVLNAIPCVFALILVFVSFKQKDSSKI